MTRPLVREYTSADEYIDREMNDAEFAQWQIDEAWRAERNAAVASREAEREALLARLGITADEAQLLLGGN